MCVLNTNISVIYDLYIIYDFITVFTVVIISAIYNIY